MSSKNMNTNPPKPSAGKATDVSTAKSMPAPKVPDNQPNDNFRPGGRSAHGPVPGRDVLGDVKK